MNKKINKALPINLNKRLAKGILENLSLQVEAPEVVASATEKLDGVIAPAKVVRKDKIKQELPEGAGLKSRFSKVAKHPKLKHTHEGESKFAAALAKRKQLREEAEAKKIKDAPKEKDQGEEKALEAQNARISWMNDIVNAGESIKGLGKSAPAEWTREKLAKKSNLELWKIRGEAQRLAGKTNFEKRGSGKADVKVPAKKAELMKGATSATQESFKGAGRTKLSVADRIALRKAALEASQAPRLESNSKSKKVDAATDVSRQNPRQVKR